MRRGGRIHARRTGTPRASREVLIRSARPVATRPQGAIRRPARGVRAGLQPIFDTEQVTCHQLRYVALCSLQKRMESHMPLALFANVPLRRDDRDIEHLVLFNKPELNIEDLRTTILE